MTSHATPSAAELDALRRRVADLERAEAERTRVADALRESEERFRTLVMNIPGAVYRCEADWPYRDILLSDGVQAITGYTAAEHLSKGGLDFGSRVHPEDRGRIEAAVAGAVANRTAFSLRYRIRHADGGVRWVQETGRAAYAPDGAPLFLDGVLVDVTAEMQATELLREQGERLRTIVENEPECVKLLDRNGNLLEMNPAGLAMIEADDFEQVRGSCMCPMIAAADEARFREMLDGVFRGESRTLEFDIIGLKGAHRTLETHSVPLWDDEEHSGVRALLGVTRDVTARRRAEAARQESEERYRGLVASVPGAVYVCDVEPPWKSTFMSEGVRELTGHGPEDFLRPDGVSFQGLALPEDRPLMDPPVAEAIRRREPFMIRYRIRDAGGKIRWVLEQGRAAYDASGAPSFLVGVITDITDRMRAEQALRDSEARLVTAQRIAHIGSWELDLRSNLLTWSDEIYRIFELDPGEFGATYETFLGAIHPEDRDAVHQAYTRTVQDRTGYDVVHRLLMRDGRIKYVHERAETIYSEDGTPLRSAGTAQDITERREAEAVREALEHQLRQAQKMEAIGSLAGGIAHDFNNILAAIIGHAELLGLDLPPEPGFREEIAAILRASRRARDLIEQILTFSRGRQREHRPMALQAVILEAVKLLRATLPATVEIRTLVDAVGPIVSADATELHQVIVNLCTNAAHAMAAHGGVLSVAYAGVEASEAFASATPGMHAGHYARLTVSDTGHGMDQQTMDRIFEPFFTTKKPGEGTGLGLAVVHGIMQSHGGAVTVSSTPGQGTTFNLYFPAVSGGADADLPEDPRPRRGSGEHVLVVDDEPAVVNISRRMLEQLGYRVTPHSRSLEALATFEADPAAFDLVLCDLTMPQMTGLDFAARVHELRPELPVLLTSGYSGSLDTQSLQRAGIRELVGKPFAMQTLAEAIARHLARG